jgi:hypothetical protein
MKAFWAVSLLFLAAPAMAQYHAGSGKCAPLTPHMPDVSVNVTPGQGASGNPVAPADLNPLPYAAAMGDVALNLDIPVSNYINTTPYNADLSESRLNLGTVTVPQQGTPAWNGVALEAQPLFSTECQP